MCGDCAISKPLSLHTYRAHSIIGPLIIGAIFSHFSNVPFSQIRLFENLSFFFIRVTQFSRLYTFKGFMLVNIQRVHSDRERCAERKEKKSLSPRIFFGHHQYLVTGTHSKPSTTLELIHSHANGR